VASFFKFIDAKASIACMMNFFKPRKVVHRMPLLFFRICEYPLNRFFLQSAQL
jgi:hypothetical protein